jgi:DNA-directed RNA polymerase subunit beta
MTMQKKLSSTGFFKDTYGKTERMTFRRVPELADVPYLLDIQMESFKRFLTKGIHDVLEEFNPITDYSGKVELYFMEHYISDDTKYSEAECLRRGQMFVKPLKVKVRVVFKETGEVVEQEVFLGDVPIMTNSGYFIVNGVARVIVNQIIKSPSVYFSKSKDDKTGKEIIDLTMSPTHGAYIEMTKDINNIITVVPNRAGKINLATFLRGLDLGSDQQLLEMFAHHPIIKTTIEKSHERGDEPIKEKALLEISRKMRPSELPNAEAMETGLNNMFFTFPNYDLAVVGRYKFNKKLCLASRIVKGIAAEDIKIDGKVIVKEGQEIGKEDAEKIQNAGINSVSLLNDSGDAVQIIGNNRVNVNSYLGATEFDTGIKELVHYPTLQKVIAGKKTKADKIKAVAENARILVCRHLYKDDIIAAISYLLNMHDGIGMDDNVDHLGNRRLNTVGDLMGRHFKDGMLKLRNSMREIMQTLEINSKTINPLTIINAKAITRALRDFCAVSQLSHVMDTNNPLTEITQKRKITAVGPGGITKERATSEVRDLHYTHNGRLCAIETPEGQSIGLVNSLALFARINEYGFITAPLRRIDKNTGKVTDIIDYLTADEEDAFFVAQAIEPLNADKTLKNEYVLCRHRDTVQEVTRDRVDYLDASPRQFISLATALIPFLENDDTGRALLGSNMQRQAVPLIKTETPFVATGLECRAALDSNVLVTAAHPGTVVSVTADAVAVERDGTGERNIYKLMKLTRFNEEACVNQKPCVKKGDRVDVGDILADGYATNNGELAIGKNMCVAYMNWEGYNFEDAILISERVVKDDKFTSIALHLKECKARTTKLGDEEITRDIPNLSEDALANLDERGIVRVGSFVRVGDILVGKVTPKGETELTPEERLLRAIFGEKAREVRDSSLRVENGKDGVVVSVACFSRKNKDEMDVGVNEIIKVTIAQKRNIKVGDKMTGRHGNKGIISKVMPAEDMPYMADGTPVDIVLNPLGVPSRLNIGQLLEVHLGLIAKTLGWKIATPVFNGATEQDIKRLLRENGLPDDGKMQLYDGRTGEPFQNKTTVGYMYMLKLHHMVDTKIHARSTGAYSLVTQQPLGGKAQFGGQRMGEMEVWALEAYGASRILQEMLTVKSDDVVGRTKTFMAIVNGQPLPEPGIPEATKVMIRELQGLGLDVGIYTADKKIIDLPNPAGIDEKLDPFTNKPRDTTAEVTVQFEPEGEMILESPEPTDDIEEFDLNSLFE